MIKVNKNNLVINVNYENQENKIIDELIKR